MFSTQNYQIRSSYIHTGVSDETLDDFMPRLLNRLLRALDNRPTQSARSRPRTALSSSRKLTPQTHLKEALPIPSFSPHGRTHSVLLDEHDPVTNSRLYKLRKRPPQRPRRNVGVEPVAQSNTMPDQEREWQSSPYLRMLSSPMRQCFVTHRYLPKDFLIRLTPARLPHTSAERSGTFFVPDGIEHPHFKPQRSGLGYYILCWKDAVGGLIEKGEYRSRAPNLTIHPRVAEQIGHLLRVRVLQELELITTRKSKEPPGILRRLTRSELQKIRETGVIPFPNAVAVIILPPLNRDTSSKTRPSPASSSTPTSQSMLSTPQRIFPISTLHPITSEELPPHNESGTPSHSLAQVPLYNAVSLFPSPEQRSALHQALKCLLAREYKRTQYRDQSSSATDNTLGSKISNTKEKFSHAFLITFDCSSSQNTDVAALAIALWRVRMWEGGGWETQNHNGSPFIFVQPNKDTTEELVVNSSLIASTLE